MCDCKMQHPELNTAYDPKKDLTRPTVNGPFCILSKPIANTHWDRPAKTTNYVYSWGKLTLACREPRCMRSKPIARTHCDSPGRWRTVPQEQNNKQRTGWSVKHVLISTRNRQHYISQDIPRFLDHLSFGAYCLPWKDSPTGFPPL